MGYAEHNLISGENITYRGHLHWVVLLPQTLVACLLDACAIAIIVLGTYGSSTNLSKFLIPASVLIIVSVIILLSAIMGRAAAEFVITDRRVIIKLGIFHKRTAEIFLHKIESVGVDQTITGRLLGYGTITVHGTGGTSEEFETIAQPFEFRRQIQEQIGRMPESFVATNRSH